jgi:hypothetical protein
MKVLMVITSHDQLGNTGKKTGFWLEELAAPYYTFKDAGVEVTLASPKGGRPPLDPASNEPDFRTDLTRRFEKDEAAQAQLDKTLRLDSVKQEDFDTVFYPGGHGPMWEANRHRLSFDWSPASRQGAGRQASGEKQGSYRLHQRRGRSGRPHEGCAISRGR